MWNGFRRYLIESSSFVPWIFLKKNGDRRIQNSGRRDAFVLPLAPPLLKASALRLKRVVSEWPLKAPVPTGWRYSNFLVRALRIPIQGHPSFDWLFQFRFALCRDGRGRLRIGEDDLCRQHWQDYIALRLVYIAIMSVSGCFLTSFYPKGERSSKSNILADWLGEDVLLDQSFSRSQDWLNGWRRSQQIPLEILFEHSI